jgi:hypothetical protein
MTTNAQDTTTGASSDAGTGGSGSSGNGSGEGGNASASGSQSGQSGSGDTPFYSSVQDPTLREYAEKKGWKGLDDVLKSNQEAEKLISQRPAAPVVPKDAKEYTFKVPENAKDLGYSEDFAGWFKNAALKAKVPVENASALHDEFVSYAGAATQAAAKAQADHRTKLVGDALTSLEKDWGAQGTPTYKRNMEMAQRAVRLGNPAVRDELKAIGALVEDGGKTMIAAPELFKMLAKMGEGMYSEDNLDGNGGGSGSNPFAAETEDLAMQGRLIQQDPDKAALLIKAAGKEDFFRQFMSKRQKK